MTILGIVEVGFGLDPFDYATLDAPANWATVTTDVRDAAYQTSTRSDRFGVFSAGWANINLDNRQRVYDPTYASSTYVGEFLRGTPVRIIGVHELGTATFVDSSDRWAFTAHGLAVGDRVRFSTAGTNPTTYAADTDYFVVSTATANTFQLSATLGGSVIAGTGSDSDGTWTLTRLETQWYGYAKSWTPSPLFPDEATTTLHAVDLLGVLAQYDLATIASAHSGETAGDRIGRVLDSVGFPSSYRSLGAGTDIQATTFGVNALAHVSTVALSDGGVFYAQRDGVATFDGQAALASARQTTAQDVIGHNAAPTPLNDGSFILAGHGLGYRNLVRITRTGGETSEVDNVGSNELPVSFDRTGLLHNDDSQSAQLAQFYADLFGTETPYVSDIRMAAITVNETVNTVLFLRKLRDRVTVEADLPGPGSDISYDCFIDGVRGRLGDGWWSIDYVLSSADAYDDNLASAPSTWLILDDASNGVLDTDKLGY